MSGYQSLCHFPIILLVGGGRGRVCHSVPSYYIQPAILGAVTAGFQQKLKIMLSRKCDMEQGKMEAESVGKREG